jgi:tetratricopeptide (TPR) repeat protein
MALFGFNKQKVLANAEKYVQQGKLQNAISEYEKVLKNDPKDLTVNNTVGDLYSRLGESDKATECFKSVGDAYASQGFTVKAIAMYKKISKLKPSLESLLKLAELYTQQGLFNDARAQYLQVAEEFLKAGELENAVRIFQKILEMDPENSTMRVRLAEVYVRLGKKTEAWQIFQSAAESLRSKGSLSAADEILQRMLSIDPGNTYALLMQGKNLLESGDGAGAVTSLQKVADIDTHPDGLRDLLKAYLQTGQLSEAGAVASKLLTVHNDLMAISAFADALMQAGQYDNALQVYDQHAERLLAENSDKVLESLHTIIGHVRENPDSLQKLLDLFNKAGESTHIGEVLELLAHASVQSGDLPRARDLYQRLAQIEPQNPLHMQNYQQVVSQLGGTSGGKLITPEEAVVLIDDLEATAPSVHQHYSDEISLSVRSALTDAELFISYNMPQKALGPLTAVLPLAPNDLRINQRLAALHTRASRFAEAAVCCRTLQSVYSDAEYPDEATRYGELAERYEERTSTPAPAVATEEEHIFLDAAPQAEEPASAAAEFSIEEPSAELPVEIEDAATVELSTETPVHPEPASPWPKAQPAATPEFSAAPESAHAESEASEIDLSSEWDDSLTVETDTPALVEPVAEVAEAAAAPSSEVAHPEDQAKIDDTVEEIRFYLAHSMPEQALAALAKLQTLTSDHAKIEALRSEVETALEAAAEEKAQAAEPVVEELSADDIPTAEVAIDAAIDEVAIEEVAIEETAAPVEEPAAIAAEPAVVQPVAQEEPEIAVEPEPVSVAEPEVAAVEEIPVVEATREPEVAAAEPEPAPSPAVLKEFVTDLESSLAGTFPPATVAKPAAKTPEAPAPQPEPAVASAEAPAVLGEFVADIEASLGEDFLKAAPVPEVKPAPAAQVAKPVPAIPPVIATPAAVATPKLTPPLAASAAASASASMAPPPAPVAASPVAPAAQVHKAPLPIIPPAPAPVAKASPFAEDAGVDLAEMFGELKQDLEAGATANDEDPETHFNLGIAFREMGLLDEAIGELQKACQAFDRGRPFSQVMQTYTWLAQCFLEKGVPEAAVRWYDKALQMPTIDGETRTALHYELASAYEASGDKPAALKHFMDVYGSNIDYRDVSERIKALKS